MRENARSIPASRYPAQPAGPRTDRSSRVGLSEDEKAGQSSDRHTHPSLPVSTNDGLHLRSARVARLGGRGWRSFASLGGGGVHPRNDSSRAFLDGRGNRSGSGADARLGAR
jgi:hypothetical protein